MICLRSRGSSSRTNGNPGSTALLAAFGWICLELMGLFISRIAPCVKTQARKQMKPLRDLHVCFQRDSESRVLAKKSESARRTSISTSWLRERRPKPFGSGSSVTRSVRFGRRNRGGTESNTDYGLAGNGKAMERHAGSRSRVGPVRPGPKIPECLRRKTA